MKRGSPFFLALAITAVFSAVASAQVPGGSPPYGKLVGSGTITPLNPRLTFSDGPFAVPNPSAQGSILNLLVSAPTTPTCTDTPSLPGGLLSSNQCDFFNLTTGASAVAATKNLQVVVSWPDANNPTDQSEFDLYVYDASGNVVAGSFSGNAAPRSVTMPIPPDGTNYTIQVVPFNPEGFSYTATVQLIAKPTFTVPPPNPAAARFQTYLSPAGMGENAGEPSIGIDWNANDASLRHGTVNAGGVSFFQSGPNTLRLSFDDCSSPAAHLWEDVSTPLVQQFVFSDPIGWVDPATGRAFSLDLIGFQGDSFMATSDDDGATWLPSQGGGVPQGGDHETLGGGPYHAPLPSPSPVYPNAIYYCSQNIAPQAECSRSDDGGRTFGPGIPIYQTTDCVSSGSIHGHVKVGPNGDVFVPSGSCAAGPGLAVSKDNGITWTYGHPPGQTNTPSLVDPSVAIDAANNVYLIWLDGNTNHPYVAVSHDEGATWSNPFDVGAAYGIQNANFVISTAGDANRAAVGFIGTTVTGNPQASNFPGIWDLYIATTYDGGNTWTTRDATPGDPVQLGCVWTSGGSNPCRNLLDFNDMHVDSQGRVEVAFAKGCLASANCTLATASQHGAPYPESVASKAAVARQSGGLRMFARFDPPAVSVPGNPRLNGATVDPVTGYVMVTWDAPDDGGSPITGYSLYRGTSPGAEVLYANLSPSRTSFMDTQVSAANTYYYYVTAANAAGTSEHCGEIASQAAVVVDPSAACKMPGAVVATDAAGDQNAAPANAELDMTGVDIAEPYPSPAGTSSIVFTIPVSNLSQLPALQPNAEWKVSFNVTDDAGAARTIFVAADTDDPTRPNGEFGYGYTGGTTDYGQGGAGVTGTFNFADNTIVMILDTSRPIAFTPGIGSADVPFTVTFAPGMTLNSVSGTTVALIGSQPGGIGGGLLETIDVTGKAAYTLVGNGFCRPDGPVIAVLQATPDSGCSPLTVNFDGSRSIDAAGDAIVSYTFNFGDGSSPVTQSSPTVSHTYGSGGAYRPNLTVACARGTRSTNDADAEVDVDDPPAAPAISAPASAKPNQSGLKAAVASHTGSRYTWSISNGSITSGQGTSGVTFAAGLKGSVTLSVTEISSAGCVSPAGTATVPIGKK
jgi:hypothetical protein